MPVFSHGQRRRFEQLVFELVIERPGLLVCFESVVFLALGQKYNMARIPKVEPSTAVALK